MENGRQMLKTLSHLEKVSCLLGQFGSNKLEVLLVKFALQMIGHFILIESAVFAQRTYKLNPVKANQVWKINVNTKV